MIKKILQEKTLALIIWCSFLAALICFYLFHALRLMHPFPVPAILFVYLLIPATIILCIKGLIKTLFYPQRLKSAGWTLLGITPFLIYLFIQQALYHSFQSGQLNYSAYNFEINQSASYQSLKRMYLYPYRFEGEKVVMWTDWKDWDEGAWQQVRKMDESIKKMEKILGKECSSKIHWIRPERGTSTGMNLQGMMFGTVPDKFIEDEDFQLNTEDTGGMAGVVLDHLSGNLDHPVTLLKLGWSSYQHETVQGRQAEILWQDRLIQDNFSFRELISSNSGFLHYEIYGGPFVEYLINTYGNKKFLELYSASSPETFPDEVERICGLSLETLEENFWADLEKRVSSTEHLKKFNPIFQVKLAEGVDEKEWFHFSAQFVKEYHNSLIAFQNSHYEVLRFDQENDSEDEVESSEFELYGQIFQDDLRTKVIQNDTVNHRIQAWIGSPDSIFQLKKELSENNWSLETSTKSHFRRVGKDALYNWKKDINEKQQLSFLRVPYVLYMLDKYLQHSETVDLTVTGLKKINFKDYDLWEVTIRVPQNTGSPRIFAITFDPQNHWVLKSFTSRNEEDSDHSYRIDLEVQFPSENSPLPNEIRFTRTRITSKEAYAKTYYVYTQKPMEILEKEFLPETYGVTLPVIPNRTKYIWKYRITFCAMFISFSLGTILLVLHQRKIKKKIPEPIIQTSVPQNKKERSRKKKMAWGLAAIIFFVMGHQLFVWQIRKNTWASNYRRLPNDTILRELRYPYLFSNTLAKFNNEILEEVVYFLRGKKYTRLQHLATHPYTDYDFYKFPHSDEISYIELYNSNLTDYGFRQLEKLTGTRNITMEGENITDAMISYLGQMNKLVALTLFSTQVTDEGLKRLDQFRVLDRLTLENNPITEKGIKDVSRIPSLRRVNLRDFPITQQSMKDLSQIPKLMSLSLRCPDLTDEMLLELKGHPTLQELYLYRAKITDKSIPVILSIINLNRLRIEETQISESGFQKLKKQIPDFN